MKISVVAGLPTEPLHSDRGSPRKQNIVRRRLLFRSNDVGIAASPSE